MGREEDAHLVTPDLLLRAYEAGIFPMAENADDPGLYWIEPKERGIIPLNGFHLSKSLAKTIRSGRFDVRINRDFDSVIAGCAAEGPDRRQTWINARIRSLYGALFDKGHVHTVEVYVDDQLAGGLYGVSLGGAFFGESMFHTVRDASKVALVYLVARLKRGGYVLLDTQFVTPHLAQFGAIAVRRARYRQMLARAMDARGDFFALPADASAEDILQIIADQRV